MEAPRLIVISAGMQKAASASYFNLTNGLLVAAGNEDVHTLRRRFGLGFFMSAVNCNVGPLRAYKLAWLSLPLGLGQSFVVKTHETPSVWARLWMRMGVARATYIFRDPREVALSLFDHGERLRREGRASLTQFQQLDSLDRAIVFTGRLLPIWRAWTQLPGVLAVRFEDYTHDLPQEAVRLSRHLGLTLDDTAVRQVAERLAPTAAVAATASKLHLHSGRGGGWSERMTKAQIETSQKVFGSYLALMGY
jgi:hypothetical protein